MKVFANFVAVASIDDQQNLAEMVEMRKKILGSGNKYRNFV